MIVCKSKILLSISLVLTVASSRGQANISRLDTFFNALAEQGKINGNVLVAEGGKVLFSKSFGYADIVSNRLNDLQTQFNLASVSKPFTAVAVFQLIERGKLKLEDHLSSYFPDFPFKEITVRHLLSHTSGLPNIEELFTPLLQKDSSHVVTNSDVLPELKSYGKPLHFNPGEKYEYGNIDYCLLALLVEKLSKTPFPLYLQKYIFSPAGMKHTVLQIGDRKGNFDNEAIKYVKAFAYKTELRPVNQVPELRKWTYNWQGLTGQGNILSTTGDLWLFDQALYNGKLVKKASLEQMFSPVKLNNGTIPYFRAGIDEAAYGLGWFIYKNTASGKVVWHSGGIPGMNTFFLRNIDKNQVIVTTDNAQNATIAPETYLILNNKPFDYKKSVAFAYVNKLLDKGSDDALALLIRLTSDPLYQLNEGELNYFGLKLFDDHHQEQSLEVLRLNTLLFPNSFNVYDSYAEILLKTGKKEAAIAMYQKSIALNPKNEGGIKALEKLNTSGQ